MFCGVLSSMICTSGIFSFKIRSHFSGAFKPSFFSCPASDPVVLQMAMISIFSDFGKVLPIFPDRTVFLYIFDEKRKCLPDCPRHFSDHLFCMSCQGDGISRSPVYILSYFIVHIKYFLPQNRAQCLPTASLPSFRGACRAALCLRFPLLARYVFGKKKTDLKSFKSVS